MRSGSKLFYAACCTAALLAAAVGCGSGPEEAAAGGPTAERAPAANGGGGGDAGGARTLPVPTAPSAGAGGGSAGSGSGSGVQLSDPPPAADGAGLTWTVPPSWTQVTPDNSIRLAQYRVPGPGGPGEMVVFYFGPGQGGDPLSNAVRWARQFTAPDGSPLAAMPELVDVDGAGVPTQIVEVRGDYTGGMSDDPIADAMLLGGIADGPDAPWFFKLVGPRSTLESQREAFVEMMRSVRVGS